MKNSVIWLSCIGIIGIVLISCYLLSTRHTMARAINDTLKRFNENINIGILVQDLQTGNTLYAKNPDRLFAPASTQKLFTAWAALHYLTPEFTYQTQLKLDLHQLQQGVLHDNIYLTFVGDPTFTHDQLEVLIASLAQAGIQTISGKLIVNDTAFDNVPMSPGMSWDDADTRYGSPVNAIIIDHNCVYAKLKPAAHAGLPALLELPDYPQLFTFKNDVITQPANTPDCELHVTKENNIVRVKGCIAESSHEKVIGMAITEPRQQFELLLTTLLTKYHIQIKQGVAYGTAPATTPIFKTISSQPLLRIITDMLKQSNNIIANSLYKTIGAHYAKSQGTWQNGQQALTHFMAETLRSPVTDFAFVGGAGLSRYLAHSPQQVITLLQQIYASPYRDFFFSALPIAGVDGTLKERLQHDATRGKIFAKTGTLTGVSALAGYMIDSHSQRVFAIAINSFGSAEQDYKKLEDDICLAIAET